MLTKLAEDRTKLENSDNTLHDDSELLAQLAPERARSEKGQKVRQQHKKRKTSN